MKIIIIIILFIYLFFKQKFLFYLFGRAACGILVPWPGIEPTPPAVEVQSLNHWTTKEVWWLLFFEDNYFCVLKIKL